MQKSGIYKEQKFGDQMMAVFGGGLEISLVKTDEAGCKTIAITTLDSETPLKPGTKIEKKPAQEMKPTIYLKFGSTDSIEALEKLLASAKEELTKEQAAQEQQEKAQVQEILKTAENSGLLAEVVSTALSLARQTKVSYPDCLVLASKEWDL